MCVTGSAVIVLFLYKRSERAVTQNINIWVTGRGRADEQGTVSGSDRRDGGQECNEGRQTEGTADRKQMEIQCAARQGVATGRRKKI